MEWQESIAARTMAMGSVVAGILAAGLSLVSTSKQFRPKSIWTVIASLLGTALAAWFVGEVLVIAHIPSGH